MNFLSGYKTKGLSSIATLAQIVGALKPEYAGICNTVTAIALSATPFTMRDALTKLASHVSIK